MHRFSSSIVALVVVMAPGVARPAGAQDVMVADAGQGPRFLLASAKRLVPLDVDRTPVLARRLELSLDGVTLKQALAEISSQAGLRLAFSDNDVPLERRVHLRAELITVAAALTDVLFGAGIDVVFGRDGGASLVKRPPPPPTGSIVGRVTSAQSGEAIEGVEVHLQGTQWRTLTGTDGQYRLAEVDTGTYVLTARKIGFTRQSRSVTVVEGQETTADFALQAAVTKLEELVTTGTMVPTEVKAMPTPISIISESDIAAQRPRTVQQIFRQVVPSAVSWDFAGTPFQTAFSVRGTSSLQGGSGQMKVFVDGIEVANTTNAFIDPNSIRRVEVIRGPQAAAIYGSDAVGGVIQVFTKRGDPSLTRPQLDGEAAVALVQTPYAGYRSELRQNYRGSVSGGGPGVSYNFGAGYTYTPDWVQPVSAQSSGSVHGSVRVTRGLLTADVSGRQYVLNTPQVFNPDLASTGFVSFTQPNYRLTQRRAQTLGARLTLAPASWWHHTVTVGIDRLNIDDPQKQPRLRTPADTFLFYFNSDQTKTSISYNSSLTGALGRATTGSLTVGFDHYSLPFTQWSTGSAPSTSLSTGNIGPAPVTRTITNNTGYFAQAQLGFRDALFLTGGLRAEQNTNFGDSLGAPVSPQAGLTYVHTLGGTTLKLRGSWGRAIRPPGPGAKVGRVDATSVRLPNPSLAPERQQGWDTGVDLVIGTRGSVSLSYFSQTAENVIIDALVATDPVLTFQNQNVARVKNSGIEVEGTLALGVLQLRGQYGYARSRIRELGPNYSGDQAVGDEPRFIPTHTAGALVSVVPRQGTTLAVGATYVGSWRAVDGFALFSCFGGTGPCRPGPGQRNYVIDYPSLLKLNATVSQQFTRLVSAFVSVDNLTNNTNFEGLTSSTVMGRISTVGLNFHY